MKKISYSLWSARHLSRKCYSVQMRCATTFNVVAVSFFTQFTEQHTKPTFRLCRSLHPLLNKLTLSFSFIILQTPDVMIVDEKLWILNESYFSLHFCLLAVRRKIVKKKPLNLYKLSPSIRGIPFGCITLIIIITWQCKLHFFSAKITWRQISFMVNNMIPLW